MYGGMEKSDITRLRELEDEKPMEVQIRFIANFQTERQVRHMKSNYSFF